MGPDECELMMPSHAVATEEVHDLTAHGAGIMRSRIQNGRLGAPRGIRTPDQVPRRYLALIGVAPTRDSRQNPSNYRASLKWNSRRRRETKGAEPHNGIAPCSFLEPPGSPCSGCSPITARATFSRSSRTEVDVALTA